MRRCSLLAVSAAAVAVVASVPVPAAGAAPSPAAHPAGTARPPSAPSTGPLRLPRTVVPPDPSRATAAPAIGPAAVPAIGPAVLPAVVAGHLPGRGTPPRCGDPESPDFPLKTRVRGGPSAYTPGGGWRTWSVELRNTTAEDCRGVHPVAVVVDSGRRLSADSVELEFHDPAARDWRPVVFETTERDEHIGVFGDQEERSTAQREKRREREGGDAGERRGGRFPGFTVPSRDTLTVRARMRFAEGAGTNRVRLTVATVQRRGDDGDWIGESDAYAFGIRTAARPRPEPPPRRQDRPPGDRLAETGGPVRHALRSRAVPVGGALVLAGGLLVLASRRGRP